VAENSSEVKWGKQKGIGEVRVKKRGRTSEMQNTMRKENTRFGDKEKNL